MRTHKKRTSRKPQVSPISSRNSIWPVWLAYAAIAVVLCLVYQRTFHGPLLFDDRALPFGQRQLSEAPLRAWLSGVRPALMFTYWLNYQFSGTDTLGYHLLNMLLHAANGILLFVLFLTLLPGRRLLCAFGACIFLLHPLQSESVANLAGRSELLVAFFLLSATLLFLRARDSSWRWAISVTALLGIAVLSKEQALAVIPFFLLLESGWFEGSDDLRRAMAARIRAHWRLWSLLAAIGGAGSLLVVKVLSQSKSAGLSVPGRPPLVYFFTECRVLFRYLRLFVVPAGQHMDPHPPLSQTLLDHGAIFGLAAILLLVWLCFRLRHAAPLATGGFLMFLIFLAPTSSFIPLYDPMAEHRMYLPIAGLSLVVMDLFSRVHAGARVRVAAIASVLAVLAILSFARNRVWCSTVALAEDVAAVPPLTQRSVKMLGQAYLAENRAQDFIDRISAAPPPDLDRNADMLTEFGLALACAGREQEAVEKLRQALAIQDDAFAFGLKGYLEARLGRAMESLHDLQRAIQLGPDFDTAHGYLGLWYLTSNQSDKAARCFRTALSLNPFNKIAQEGLREIERRQSERAAQQPAE